jgi:hypothetical protein
VKTVKIVSGCLTMAGLLVLGACSQGEKAAEPKVSSTVAASPTSEKQHNSNSGSKNVVESQGIHLEFVPEKSADRTHLDVFVQKGDNHEPIPTAKVKAQIQSPDGKQQSLDFKYDAAGKHFAAVLPGTTTGQYQVKVTADVNGKKVDGRFTFNR